ncbi:polysaccharide biosynthesis/export family protein [Tranquillimonas alkanivorans]|uniref:Polysaccharide export outer membrane protein n=1 Tax=Tranquillimonas alkanivorans TaxID=441119 RepID=A0A1I5KGB8_9RHOB|nr:polysaccharide biosynthesis/export family protein [Tranquillimonas alkanivorans]SFO84080.1 polysaccharide export outer membrane protein [Tranquillimonas alkanivorans]
MILRKGLIAALTAAVTLSGCSQLPRGAVVEREITREAAKPDADFAFYQVTRALLPVVETWPETPVERSDGWPRAMPGSVGQIIQPGDTLNVTIWDSDTNSLLTAPGQQVAPLGAMSVSPAGRVFIPYVGEVRVAGMSPERAREAIQRELESISPNAQVQVTFDAGRQNTVDLVAGVTTPGSYPLPNRNYSVLSLISQGGGIPTTLRNPRVKLQRGGKVYAVAADTLFEHPEADAVLVGGDKVIVEEDERFFLALGASGREEIVYFPQDELTALEAIALMGGVVETRADPGGILVLREYPRAALVPGARGPRSTDVVFSVDLTTPDGLFSAKNFEIEAGDVVIATESPVTSLRTAFALFGAAFGLVTTVANNT